MLPSLFAQIHFLGDILVSVTCFDLPEERALQRASSLFSSFAPGSAAFYITCHLVTPLIVLARGTWHDAWYVVGT